MNLLIFNLAVDYDDTALAFSTDWINALAEKAEKVYVITMRIGRDETRENVIVYSVGREKGYTEARRALIFYQKLMHILSSTKIDACFSHMMPLFSIMGGLILKFLKKPQFYRHGNNGHNQKSLDEPISFFY